MDKPILFHDVDGVLFADYSGHYQLRPNVKGWLEWAHEHFQVVWLTTWQQDDLKNLLKILYCEKYVRHPAVQFRVADWYSYNTKEEWLASKKVELAKVSWTWIDDNIPPAGRLEALDLDPSRCLSVDSKGADELVTMQGRLTQLLNLLPVRSA